MRKTLTTLVISAAIIAMFASGLQAQKGHNDQAQGEKIQLDSLYELYYHEATDKMQARKKYTFEHDENGNRTEYALFYSKIDESGNKTWDKYDFKQSKFDEQNRIIEHLTWWMSNDETQLVLRSKRIFEYSGDDLISEKYYYWSEDDGEWEYYSLTEKTYDSGNLSQELEYHIESSGELDLEYKNEYRYNEQGKIAEFNSFYHKDATDEWISSYRMLYSYDDSGNLVEFITMNNEDNQPPQWSVRKKFIHHYEDDFLVRTIEYYNNDYGVLTPQYKYDFTYDKSYAAEDVILDGTITYQFPLKYKVISAIGYKLDGEMEYVEMESQFFYSGVGATSVVETKASEALLYPNPTSDAVHFAAGEDLTGSTIEIYDLTGRKLITQTLSGNPSVSLGSLDAGIYIYKLTAVGSVKTGKIVKE